MPAASGATPSRSASRSVDSAVPRTQTATALKLSWRGIARASMSRCIEASQSSGDAARASDAAISTSSNASHQPSLHRRNAVAVADAIGDGDGVRLDAFLDAEGGDQLILLRMRLGLLGRDEAGVDHPLDDAVVRRQRGGGAVADAIEAGIADVRPERALALDVDPEDDDGRVHPGDAVRFVLRRLDVLVRGEHRGRERAGVELGGVVAERVLERGDGAPRRLGAAAMAAGAVGEDGDPARAFAADPDLVLVALALPELAARRSDDVERHAHFGAADFSRRSRSSCCSYAARKARPNRVWKSSCASSRIDS